MRNKKGIVQFIWIVLLGLILLIGGVVYGKKIAKPLPCPISTTSCSPLQSQVDSLQSQLKVKDNCVDRDINRLYDNCAQSNFDGTYTFRGLCTQDWLKTINSC